MADSKRIGHINANGGVVYPQESISGRPYEFPPTQVKQIGGGRFVVLDIFPAPDFDLDAELAKLKPAPVASRKADPAPAKDE